MSRINWEWSDIDASQLTGSPTKGSLELPNGDVVRWVTVNGNRMYYLGDEVIYDPTDTDKLTVMAAIAIEDVLTELENEYGQD
jgi:hypothetical protein